MNTADLKLRRGRALVALLSTFLAAGASSIGGPAASAAAPIVTATAVDPTFGGGLVKTNLSPLDDEALAVAVQPDGATVVAGQTNFDPFTHKGGDLLVSRYTAAGVLDPSFGTGGSFVLSRPNIGDVAYAVMVQPDGRIVVGGKSHPVGIVIRLTPAGELDPEFQGGVVTFPDVANGEVKALAAGPDGTLRVGGIGVRFDARGDFQAYIAFQARLTPDGARDLTFAPAGLVVGDAAPQTRYTTVALLPDGLLLAGGGGTSAVFAGGPGNAALVARYLATGGIDPLFGTGGLTMVDPDTSYVDRGTRIDALAVQPDGRIVAVGDETIFGAPAQFPMPGPSPPSPTGVQHVGLGNVAVWRFLADGTRDTTFAATGQVITEVPPQTGVGAHMPAAQTVADVQSNAASVVVAADGAILVGGWSAQPYPEFVIVRYTASGLVDTTFGRAGFLSVDLGGPQGVVNAMAFAPDGRLAVAGSTRTGYNEPPNYRDLLVGRVVPGSNRGLVWTWGWNGVGQLGDGTTTDRQTPVPVPGLSGIVAVAGSPYHSLALKGDGTVWAWGWNVLGQLGDGTTTDRHAPVKVPGLTGVVAIGAGGLHSLALRGDGTVWGWGYNGYGQLGDGTLATRLTPTKTQLTGITSISAGLFHNLAIREEGTAWSWGYNGYGELGDGTYVSRTLPVALPPQYNNFAYEQVSAGWLQSSSVNAIGERQTWGADFVGQITGLGGPGVHTPGAYAAAGLLTSSGGYHSLAVAKDGTVGGQGWNALGQLWAPTPATSSAPGLTEGPIVSAGGLHSLALTTDRRLLAWGWNYFGQLGTGDIGGSPAVRAVLLANPVMVAAAGYHSLAIQG